MNRKRVVITGLSAITPLGLDLETTWDAILSGKSGVAKITHFDTTGFDTDIAGEVKGLDLEKYMNPKQARQMDKFVQYAVCAVQDLIKNSAYEITPENAEYIGIILGVGLGGLGTLETFHSKLVNSGPSRVSPFYIPMLISNMAPGQAAIFTGAKGPNMVLTSACASGTHAISSAYSEILLGRCDAIITGGSEATITPMGISGFTSMKALCSKYNDEPERASCPFSADRSGFVMGEGAALLLLETLDSALARNAKIYAEIVGVGASEDAYHIVAPREDAEGMATSMRRAIRDAGIACEDITHINAHGTSTGANDAAETKALHKVFGEHAKNLAISANKSQLGHLLGASGAVEAVIAVKTLETGMVPGTINLVNPDPACDLNYMADGPKQLNPKYVMSNSFGFGGTNGSIIFKKYEA